MTNTEAALAAIAEALGVDPQHSAPAPTATRTIAPAVSVLDRNLALIDSATGLSPAETKGFAEIESFAPYHQMPEFLIGFADRRQSRRSDYTFKGAEEQAYDRGLMAASLCNRLGL